MAQLEEALSNLRAQASSSADNVSRKDASPRSTRESNSKSPSTRYRSGEAENNAGELARNFEGLNIEHDGRISFHGPTSLFQLPSGGLPDASSTSHLPMQLETRKERLINNAWRERAYEQMATMPVSLLPITRQGVSF